MTQALDALIEKIARRDSSFEIILNLFDANADQSHFASEGELNGAPITQNTQHFIASTTKLFATALILQLVDAGELNLDTPLSELLGSDTMRGLHIFKGRDYSDKITVRHALSHTSGLADYFEGKPKIGAPFAEPMLAGQDAELSTDEILERVRTELSPRFAPGSAGKALYSDTNFQLLGFVLKKLKGQDLVDLVQTNIAEPLGVKSTYLFSASSPTKDILPLRNGSKILHIPKALESMPLDGGGVSTAADMMVFIRAFFAGKLFSKSHIEHMQNWNRIFFPLKYGTGIMQFKLPRIFSLFKPSTELVGHSGISGAFAFYAPAKNIYLTGTTNQLADRALPYQLMLRALNTI